MRIGHSLGGLCHIPHGQAMMMLLPHCVRYNLDRGIHAGLVRRAFGAPGAAPARPPWVRTLPPRSATRRSASTSSSSTTCTTTSTACRSTLSELGVTREDLPAVAKQARYDGAALYNETEITLEDALEILEATY